jgi:hypothetical protein
VRRTCSSSQLAALNLLGEAAASAPILLVVEDAHWLDRGSADVLAFVARRLEFEPLVLVAATRDGAHGAFDEAGLPELNLERLDSAAAAALLDARAPDLLAAVRERALREAAGNPLALVELPIVLEQVGDEAASTSWLPLTTRLEQAFAARVSDLPTGTRTLLRVAALDDADLLTEILDAGAVLGGRLTVDDLTPAVEARLVEVDGASVRFRHPLMRSAIDQRSSLGQRHAVHAALAKILGGDSDRCIWHRAAATARPDEGVASELEAAAARAQRRGGVEAAVSALERAAMLSADSGRRGERLLRAAEFAFELGRPSLVVGLLRQAAPLDLSERQRSRMVWIRERFDDGIREPLHQARRLPAGVRQRPSGKHRGATGRIATPHHVQRTAGTFRGTGMAATAELVPGRYRRPHPATRATAVHGPARREHHHPGARVPPVHAVRARRGAAAHRRRSPRHQLNRSIDRRPPPCLLCWPSASSPCSAPP